MKIAVFSVALMCCVCQVSCDYGEPTNSEHPMQGGEAPRLKKKENPPPLGSPESKFLTLTYLWNMLEQLGYQVDTQEGRVVIAVKGNGDDPQTKMVTVEFSDKNSLKMAAAWTTTSTGYSDGGIVNEWNSRRRFAKCSLSIDPNDSNKNTMIIMHADQLLGRIESISDREYVAHIAQNALKTFGKAVWEFDEYIKEAYFQKAEASKAEELGTEN
eukprot:TRINITY_DN2148_c3_g1_i1.p1 TRINITY_DN2148_c3_g1~~TRINITY_DN2148_c3_g1_i1.p1  ORF type:complete len:214 (+),score=45.67 TRINITY_DN2148_c3_g1_i1:43-684(+)